ncbi:GvpL/GvpF family gas vesicle protein [Peterkaempfera griseoplana]|uniref:GvpL/GvpF family gas vesicle protein n=1 Tax=Peterkaempfera griseoplana TaxID=66896 RepID=UPI0006E2542F|nr:GvpL/GvpF family gas vesicle protein [Peterkaempfera griseoplana]
MTATSVYTYAVLLPFHGHQEAIPELRGVGGLPVRPVLHGGLVAAVSDVPAGDFSEQALRTRLEDLAWVETTARAHHGVVAALAARTAVLPLRLATVHLDEDRLRLMLADRRCDLAEQLARLAGHAEWGVKVYALPAAQSRTPEPGSASGPADSPGRSYLRGRREQRRARERGWEDAARFTERLRSELGELADGLRRHRPQSGQLAVGPGTNVANDAYLVAEDRAAQFQQRIRSLAEPEAGLRVEVTGPWAPYSFAATAESGTAVPEHA